MTPIKSILIVGGGSSGWLAASYLARKFGTTQGGVEITLIEASDIPTVGVGEATIPPIRDMIQAIGFNEGAFMKATNATFKLAIKFDDWKKGPNWPTGGAADSYYHTFGNFALMGQDLVAPYWALDDQKGEMNFVDYTMMEGRLCDAGVGPKRPPDPQYQGVLQYAYHFDAGKLATLLKDTAKTFGVTHLVGKVSAVDLEEDGAIKAIQTEDHGTLTADLYIDCTGFHAQLIEGALGTHFNSLNDTLFCDRAVAIRIPHETPETPINPYTTATAKDNGWIWDIPLYDRRGTGYVYSSAYTDDAEAEKTLREYVGPAGDEIDTWSINIRCGYRDAQWHKNCVAVGLSAGFIEPLESTGIYLVDIALRWLGDFLPPIEGMEDAARTYNDRMTRTYRDIVDFVKLHYAISQRDDTPFWKDNIDPKSWPDTLKKKLESWKYRTPSRFEFAGLPEVFGLTNYMQVLYGMDHAPDLSGTAHRFPYLDAAREHADRMIKGAKGGEEVLPKHRELLSMLHRS